MQLENSGRYVNDLIRFNLISQNVNVLRTGFLPVILAGIFLLLVALFGVYHFNVPNENILIFVIAAVIGGYMALNIGANDVANSMGTSVGARALTIKQAILIAAVFEFLGAFLAGGEVTSTIRKGIVDPNLYTDQVNIFVIGMMSALLAGGTWLYIASLRGWPVSTTHSIVGAIIGFVLITKGVDAVSWGKVSNIAMSWVTSPLFSGILAFSLYISAKKLILDRANPGIAAITFIPFYSFLVAVVISLVTARKGLKHVGIEWTENEVYLFTFIFSIIVAIGTSYFLRRNKF